MKSFLIGGFSFLLGAGTVLVLACISSGHWSSLSYVYKAYDIRLDGGEAADAKNWRQVDRDFSSVLKIKGTSGETWVWYFPLIGWIDLDYTQGPGPSFTTTDLAVAAFAAAKSGDEARASILYGKLEKISPGTTRANWEALATGSLNHFADAADISRRGRPSRLAADPGQNPPAPSSSAR